MLRAGWRVIPTVRSARRSCREIAFRCGPLPESPTPLTISTRSRLEAQMIVLHDFECIYPFSFRVTFHGATWNIISPRAKSSGVFPVALCLHSGIAAYSAGISSEVKPDMCHSTIFDTTFPCIVFPNSQLHTIFHHVPCMASHHAPLLAKSKTSSGWLEDDEPDSLCDSAGTEDLGGDWIPVAPAADPGSWSSSGSMTS